MTARQRWRADKARYFAHLGPAPGRAARLNVVARTEGLWAIAVLRFGQYLYQEASAPVRWLATVPYKIAARLVGMLLGIHIFPSSSIGPGLYIGHYGGIWVSPLATLGATCSLSQGVVIGTTGTNAAPVIGDRVWIGPNAVVSGPVRVAAGAVIAACSLVVKNVPENAVVIGVPAKVMMYSGSARLIADPPASEVAATHD